MRLLAAAGYPSIAPDLPGYGASAGFPLETYALETQTKALAEFARRLDLDLVHIAGNSMGGAIAVLYAEANPRGVASVGFIGAPLGLIGWSPSITNSLKKGTNPFIPLDRSEFDLELALLFARAPVIPDSIKDLAVAEYLARERHYRQVWDIANLYTDCLTLRSLFSTPVFALWGTFDRVFAVEGARALSKLAPLATILSLPDVGHLPHVEAPGASASAYLGFLSSLGK